MQTTTDTTAAALLAKCRFQDEFELLKDDDPELVRSATEESLRYHPAGIFSNPRFGVKDTELGGTRILPGMPIHLAITAGNLDPAKFPDPLKFKVGRDPRGILTFGLGVHFCMGAILSRRVIQTSLATFMRRFPDFHLADPDFQPEYFGVAGELSPKSIPMVLN
jgi:cytochrome P450 PksS